MHFGSFKNNSTEKLLFQNYTFLARLYESTGRAIAVTMT